MVDTFATVNLTGEDRTAAYREDKQGARQQNSEKKERTSDSQFMQTGGLGAEAVPNTNTAGSREPEEVITTTPPKQNQREDFVLGIDSASLLGASPQGSYTNPLDVDRKYVFIRIFKADSSNLGGKYSLTLRNTDFLQLYYNPSEVNVTHQAEFAMNKIASMGVIRERIRYVYAKPSEWSFKFLLTQWGIHNNFLEYPNNRNKTVQEAVRWLESVMYPDIEESSSVGYEKGKGTMASYKAPIPVAIPIMAGDTPLEYMNEGYSATLEETRNFRIIFGYITDTQIKFTKFDPKSLKPVRAEASVKLIEITPSQI